MFIAIALAVLTGLCWTSFGIILSFTARQKRDVILFGIVQNCCCLLLALIFFVKWQNFDAAQAARFLPLVILAGALNAVGQFITNRAMQKGHNGIAWAISQSSMIIPFMAAALFLGQKSSVQQWLGVLMILGGIILPNLPQARQKSNWLGASLAAFLVFGTVQTLYLLPSLWNLTDPANLRPAAASLGMTVSWGTVGIVIKHRFEFQKSLFFIGAAMSVISICSLLLFFLAVDRLSQLQLGNIAIPLMVGSNILAFTLFSIFTIREKTSYKEIITIAALLAGLILLSQL